MSNILTINIIYLFIYLFHNVLNTELKDISPTEIYYEKKNQICKKYLIQIIK